MDVWMTGYFIKMKMEKDTGKINSFSYIRAIACIAVVVLHTVYSAARLCEESISASENIVSMAVVNSMMWAVPCFVMVTGALLLNKEISFQKLYCKYIFRALGSLVVCGMVFRIFDMVMDKEVFRLRSFLQGVYEIFTGTGWSHLWYLYLLIGLYILLPFYKKIVDYSSKNELRYLMVIYVVFLSLMPLLQMKEINCGFYIHVSTIYPFYLFCGYAIHKKVLNIPAKVTGLAVVLSTGCIVILTYLRWRQEIPVIESLWGYSSILVIIQAVGIFALIDHLKGNEHRALKLVLLKLDECSFGIYLIHMIFVRLILRYMAYNPYVHNGVVSMTLLIVCIVVISYMLTWCLKKVPGVKKII